MSEARKEERVRVEEIVLEGRSWQGDLRKRLRWEGVEEIEEWCMHLNRCTDLRAHQR